MREAEFREWLEARGAKTQAGRNSRVHAVKTIEKNLAALGSKHADLAAAQNADEFSQLRERIRTMRQDAKLSSAVPQSTAFFPPAFMATLPPTHDASADVGSTANT